jgi:hypothetical protein
MNQVLRRACKSARPAAHLRYIFFTFPHHAAQIHNALDM